MISVSWKRKKHPNWWNLLILFHFLKLTKYILIIIFDQHLFLPVLFFPSLSHVQPHSSGPASGGHPGGADQTLSGYEQRGLPVYISKYCMHVSGTLPSICNHVTAEENSRKWELSGACGGSAEMTTRLSEAKRQRVALWYISVSIKSSRIVWAGGAVAYLIAAAGSSSLIKCTMCWIIQLPARQTPL